MALTFVSVSVGVDFLAKGPAWARGKPRFIFILAESRSALRACGIRLRRNADTFPGPGGLTRGLKNFTSPLTFRTRA